MAISKDRIIDLINSLSERDFKLVSDLIVRLAQVSGYREIPLDDEPTTQEDLDAIKAAEEAFEKGELISFKDIEHELRS